MTSRSITMHTGASHFKTNIRDPKYTNYSYTLTFAGTISETGFYKNPVLLWSEAWVLGSCGTEFPGQIGRTKEKPTYGKSSSGTITGAASGCSTSTKYTFYGPIYELKSKTADSDALTFDIEAKHTSSGYNLILIGKTNLKITH
jgi:hypothetical protein